MNYLKRTTNLFTQNKQINVRYFNHNAQLSNVIPNKIYKTKKYFSDNKHKKYNKTDSEELLFYSIINTYLIIFTVPLLSDRVIVEKNKLIFNLYYYL